MHSKSIPVICGDKVYAFSQCPGHTSWSRLLGPRTTNAGPQGKGCGCFRLALEVFVVSSLGLLQPQEASYPFLVCLCHRQVLVKGTTDALRLFGSAVAASVPQATQLSFSSNFESLCGSLVCFHLWHSSRLSLSLGGALVNQAIDERRSTYASPYPHSRALT